MRTEQILTVLERVRATGERKWQALCPAHDDSSPSLSISVGDDGRTLLKCHAGCSTQDICEARGLKVADLFGDEKPRETTDRRDWPVTATYVYADAHGRPLYRVLRKTSPDTGAKTFVQERADGDGWVGRAGCMDNVQRVLYRLGEVLRADGDVYLVEGEKDSDTLAGLGIVGTTTVGGSGGWRDTYAASFRGKSVVILPDNDQAGEKYAAAALKAIGEVAASVKVVRLPGLLPGGDVSDWMRQGGTKEKLLALASGGQESRVSSFKSTGDRVRGERAERIETGKRIVPFGVSFLDDTLGGIQPKDLVMIGSKTAGGKTAFATSIALNAVTAGKRVHYFALEAEDREIERRMKFQIIAHDYWAHAVSPKPIRYQDWFLGKLDDVLGPFEDRAEREMVERTRGLSTFYAVDSFTGTDFAAWSEKIAADTDLVILDHLHYVDVEDENENRGYKRTVKQIRESALRAGKPVVVVAHVRKSDKRYDTPVPSVEDFHGSSDVPKIATKAFMIARAEEQNDDTPHLVKTYLQVVKCRTDSSVQRYTACLNYNLRIERYEPDYALGRFRRDKDGWFFQDLTAAETPHWARGAIPPVPAYAPPAETHGGW